MLRRLLGTILIVLGLAAAGLGVASATVWRESDSVVATAAPQGDGTLVVTDPGVLELIGSDVTVVATVPDGGQVTVAIGRDIDVDGWVGIDHYTRVSGLTDWDTLTSAAVEPEVPEAAEGEEPPTPGVGANPAGNDMWVAEATGEGNVTLRWTDRPGRWSLLAAGVGEDAQAPTVELTWPREPTTPWLWPGVGAGAALLLVGLLVLLVGRGKRRTEAVDDAAPTPVETPGQAGAPAERGTTNQDLTGTEATAASATPSLTRRRRSTSRLTPDVTPTTPGAVPGASPGADRLGGGGPVADILDAGKPGADKPGADKPGVDKPGVGKPESAGAGAGAGAGADSQGSDARTDDDGDAGAQAAERPARPALMSRRARRRAAAEQTAAGDHGTGEDRTEESGPEAPATAEAPEAAASQRPATGRRWAFTPVFGGSTARQPAPDTQAAPEPSRLPEAGKDDPRRRAAAEPASEPTNGTPARTNGTPAPTDGTPAPTITGSMPLPTRRELRAQEEARRAAEQTGLAGRLRALTGSIPVVRSASPEPPGQEPAAPPTRASRSQAWRQVWGFDPDASTQDAGTQDAGSQDAADDDAEGGTR